jgi:acetyl-CoA C-acetyltransferase
MTEAFVYDAIRTPRGKGKKDGSLHEVKPVNLLAGVLGELQRRNDLDTAQVDDVVMGVVSPIGEQGSVIAKVAALKAGWDFRCSGVQLNRFCASGLEAVNMAAQKVRSGWEDLVVAGGVESMSRVPIGSDGGAWAQDPETNSATAFVPQGIGADLIATLDGFTREDVDAFALESQKRAARAREGGFFAGSVVPVKDFLDQTILDQDEFIKPRTTMEGLAALKPAFEQLGAMGFDQVAIARYPQVERINHVHHAGNSSGIVDGAAAILIGSEAAGKIHNLKPRGTPAWGLHWNGRLRRLPCAAQGSVALRNSLRAARCARTAAVSQSTKRAARADTHPCAARRPRGAPRPVCPQAQLCSCTVGAPPVAYRGPGFAAGGVRRGDFCGGEKRRGECRRAQARIVHMLAAAV